MWPENKELLFSNNAIGNYRNINLEATTNTGIQGVDVKTQQKLLEVYADIGLKTSFGSWGCCVPRQRCL